MLLVLFNEIWLAGNARYDMELQFIYLQGLRWQL